MCRGRALSEALTQCPFLSLLAYDVLIVYLLVSELSCAQKFQAIAFVVLKLIALFIIVCTFICTLGLLTDAFQLLGGRGIGKLSAEDVNTNGDVGKKRNGLWIKRCSKRRAAVKALYSFECLCRLHGHDTEA